MVGKITELQYDITYVIAITLRADKTDNKICNTVWCPDKDE